MLIVDRNLQSDVHQLQYCFLICPDKPVMPTGLVSSTVHRGLT